MIALWIGLGMVWLIGWLRRISVRAALTAGLVGIALLAVPLAKNWTTYDLSKDQGAEDFMAAVLQTVEPEALIVTVGDRATFALWYARYGLQRRPDVIPVSRDLWSLESYRQTVGTIHPSLSGQQPPSDLLSLFSAALQQQRPVYLAQVGDMPADMTELGLPRGFPYRLRREAFMPPSETSARLELFGAWSCRRSPESWILSELLLITVAFNTCQNARLVVGYGFDNCEVSTVGYSSIQEQGTCDRTLLYRDWHRIGAAVNLGGHGLGVGPAQEGRPGRPIIVRWSTEFEVNTAGFNIYRSDSENGAWTKMNSQLIPGSPDPLRGGSYVFTDTNVIANQSYWYELGGGRVGRTSHPFGTHPSDGGFSIARPARGFPLWRCPCSIAATGGGCVPVR